MRPLNPLPFTRVRSTPNSRANLRTDGPACARENPGSLIGGRSRPALADADVGAVAADAEADCVAEAAPDAPADVELPAAAFGAGEDVDSAGATGAEEA